MMEAMTDIAHRSPARPGRAEWKRLDPDLAEEVRVWVQELRTLWNAVGMSINRFALLNNIDKGTVSRYLNGKRVPGEHTFLNRLLAIQAEKGKEVSPEVHEHLTRLQLEALQVAHPHEYRVQLFRNQLQVALVGQHEAESYARSLEEQLSEQLRQLDELTAEREQLRAVLDENRALMQAAYVGLTHEIADLREEVSYLQDELARARDEAVLAEQRCQQLEGRIDDLEAAGPDDQAHPAGADASAEPPDGPLSGHRVGHRSAAALPGGDRHDDLRVVGMLARQYAFGDLEALIVQGKLAPDGRSKGQPEAVAGLCAFGQRVLDLDAADFGRPEDVGEVPQDLLDRARASRMPQAPKERPRGALASLRPTYALLLEVITIHWHRRDMAALVATVHIAGQYLPLLAWEPLLGHAGDPALIGASVNGAGSRFGVPVELGAERMCDHTRPERSACERTLRVAKEPMSGWRAYLDRQHSLVASALGDCAARCRTPCTVITRLDDAVRADLTERCKLAADFADSALVRLRHAAPVGQGFGVPSPEEVEAAWTRTRKSLRRQPLGQAALGDAAGDAFPLPGLPALFSAIADATIVPDTLLHDTTAHIIQSVETDVP